MVLYFLCDVSLRKSTSKWKRKVGWPSMGCAEILGGLRRKLPEGRLPLAQSHFVRRWEPAILVGRPRSARHSQASDQNIVIKKM